jgi:hypothetical protein
MSEVNNKSKKVERHAVQLDTEKRRRRCISSVNFSISCLSYDIPSSCSIKSSRAFHPWFQDGRFSAQTKKFEQILVIAEGWVGCC